MSNSNWTDAIVGDRMAVDRQFNEQVHQSQFSSQQWGLIMTATEFEIEHADDPEEARIVANTEKLKHIMPELDTIQSQMAAMGGAGGSSTKSSGGIVSSIKNALGLGSSSDGVDDEQLAAAKQLTQAYADLLQSHLEEKGTWEQVRIAYQE
ncbi:DUF5799 family protein [Natronocalculus amylovorans]|uniref:DUF5799 family protein n=1 Tax=Natronocalculus amylovorans TaxID=2917812 RepID=A0AAE3K8F1_9EURY|nr:DUF5799 family protein [Natronocalculus amylovorans]MCL9817242.1 DUF5799 family protein [Natronocalculus amylovorans]